MEIKVKCCGGCPFCVTEINSDSIGDDTILYCNLAYFLKSKNYVIDSFDSFSSDEIVDDTKVEETTPIFCPLNNVSVKITK